MAFPPAEKRSQLLAKCVGIGGVVVVAGAGLAGPDVVVGVGEGAVVG